MILIACEKAFSWLRLASSRAAHSFRSSQVKVFGAMKLTAAKARNRVIGLFAYWQF